MWQAIIAASITVFLMRALPAFFTDVKKLNHYPKFIKFLDYTICLVTGEVIYNIAFNDIAKNGNQFAHISITVLALTIASIVMIRTSRLSLSLLSALSVFVISYIVVL